MMRQIFWRDLHLAFRNFAEIINPLWFFLIIITLFPLSIGPEPQLLRQIAPGIVWVAALLSSLLAMDRLFRDDWLDGSLQQMMLMPIPLSMVVFVKVIVHWIVSGLPLIIISPLIAVLFGLSIYEWEILALTLLLGTPTLSFVGAIGVGLTVGLRRSGVLLSLLILPLMVPLMIFATSAVNAGQMLLPIDGYIAILGAFLTASATLSPFATAAALRISVQ